VLHTLFVRICIPDILVVVSKEVSSTKSTALTFLTLSNCVSKSSVVTLKKKAVLVPVTQDSPLLICILKACFQMLLHKSIE